MNAERTNEKGGFDQEPRDEKGRGDVGPESHGAFGAGRGREHPDLHNDERLAGRGRSPGRPDADSLTSPGRDASRGAPGSSGAAPDTDPTEGL